MGNQRNRNWCSVSFRFQHKNELWFCVYYCVKVTKSSTCWTGRPYLTSRIEQDKIDVKKCIRPVGYLNAGTPSKYPALHYWTHDNNKNGKLYCFCGDASICVWANVELVTVSPKLLRKIPCNRHHLCAKVWIVDFLDKLGGCGWSERNPETELPVSYSKGVFNFGIDITFANKIERWKSYI